MKTSILFAAMIAVIAMPANAAIRSFTGTRANSNPLLPPGSAPCGPTYFNTVTIGPGNGTSTGLSNFGAFTSTQSHCIVTPPPTTFVNGVFTYAFAAGDQLFGTYTGTVALSGTPGVFNATENLIATGGTGRFLGASGTITSTGPLRFQMGSGIFSGNLAGTLSLPGVPEPATWALMIGGFGMIGGVARRRAGRPAIA